METTLFWIGCGLGGYALVLRQIFKQETWVNRRVVVALLHVLFMGGVGALVGFVMSASIDLLVTDVVMPGMSGGQLAELLAERYPRMKVLFVSGYSEQVVLRHKIANLHTNFLQKPFTLKSLAAKVREVLDASAAAAAGAGR